VPFMNLEPEPEPEKGFMATMRRLFGGK